MSVQNNSFIATRDSSTSKYKQKCLSNPFVTSLTTDYCEFRVEFSRQKSELTAKCFFNGFTVNEGNKVTVLEKALAEAQQNLVDATKLAREL